MSWLENFRSEKAEESSQRDESNDHARKRFEYESKSKLVKKLMREAVEEHFEGCTNKKALIESVIRLYEEGKAVDLQEALNYLEAMQRSTSYLND